MRILLVALALGGLIQASQPAFRIAEPDLIPEGIAYDPQTRTFFVGSTFKRKIVAVDAAGKARDFTKEAQDGAFGYVGVRVDARRRALWAISSSAGDGMPARGLDKTCLGCAMVSVYDLGSAKLLRSYRLSNQPAQHFLNDLVILPSGDVYITDTMTGDLYRITRSKNQLERWIGLGPQVFPNGIDSTPDGRTLFVATEAGIRKVDVASGKVSALSAAQGTIDGLYFHRNTLVAIQPFEEGRKVTRFHLSAAHDAIVKTEALEASHPAFRQPTTGVIVGQDLYYIANAQLQWFRGLYRNGAYDKATLTDVVVLRRRLE